MRRVAEVPKIARLKRDAHKGDRGRVLIVAGSLTMSGAARLAGWGALRGGAGLVTIATPDAVQQIVAADLPCAMTLPLPSRRGVLTASGVTAARAMAANVDAVAIGPGLTLGAKAFVRRFLDGLDVPVVIDADALNILAEEPFPLGEKAVLTPHPGEAARLLGAAVSGERVAAACALAERFGAVAVLKGAGTVVCDGERYYVNRTGNPGMATGGTGDVLAGLLAARLAAGSDPFAAAVQATHLHGLAGDLAAAAVGEHAMIALDLVASLPGAVSSLIRTEKKPGKGSGSRRRRDR